MTETDKLYFIMRTIDQDTSVVHVSAYKMVPINEMRRNDLLEGISTEDLDKKEKYVHFRQVESSEKRDKNAMDKAAFEFDFYIVLLMTLLKTHGVYT